MINVVNKYKHKPTDSDVYIGRGSPLGNPFTSKKISETKAKFQSYSVDESITNYEEYLMDKIKSKDKKICDELNKIYLLSKTKEVNLVCFCKPKKCHGDIIKRIIEEKL